MCSRCLLVVNDYIITIFPTNFCLFHVVDKAGYSSAFYCMLNTHYRILSCVQVGEIGTAVVGCRLTPRTTVMRCWLGVPVVRDIFDEFFILRVARQCSWTPSLSDGQPSGMEETLSFHQTWTWLSTEFMEKCSLRKFATLITEAACLACLGTKPDQSRKEWVAQLSPCVYSCKIRTRKHLI